MQFQSAQALPTSGPGQLKALWTLLSYRTSNLIRNNLEKMYARRSLVMADCWCSHLQNLTCSIDPTWPILCGVFLSGTYMECWWKPALAIVTFIRMPSFAKWCISLSVLFLPLQLRHSLSLWRILRPFIGRSTVDHLIWIVQEASAEV